MRPGFRCQESTEPRSGATEAVKEVRSTVASYEASRFVIRSTPALRPGLLALAASRLGDKADVSQLTKVTRSATSIHNVGTLLAGSLSYLLFSARAARCALLAVAIAFIERVFTFSERRDFFCGCFLACDLSLGKLLIEVALDRVQNAVDELRGFVG